MAHALRRISYATCEPHYGQFSFLAREPRAHFSLQYCHSFITESPEQVSLTSHRIHTHIHLVLYSYYSCWPFVLSIRAHENLAPGSWLFIDDRTLYTFSFSDATRLLRLALYIVDSTRGKTWRNLILHFFSFSFITLLKFNSEKRAQGLNIHSGTVLSC